MVEHQTCLPLPPTARLGSTATPLVSHIPLLGTLPALHSTFRRHKSGMVHGLHDNHFSLQFFEAVEFLLMSWDEFHSNSLLLSWVPTTCPLVEAALADGHHLQAPHDNRCYMPFMMIAYSYCGAQRLERHICCPELILTSTFVADGLPWPMVLKTL